MSGPGRGPDSPAPGETGAPMRSLNDGAAQADPLDLVERWLAEASEVSWGSEYTVHGGGWSNMPKSTLQAVAAEARRGRGSALSAELRSAINAVLLAYETAIRPGTLSDSDLWPALAELRRVVDAQIAQEHPLYHGEGVEHMDTTDYSRLRPCPMCSAETGQPCKVLSNFDGTLKPGDVRPKPHFYRTEIGK